MGEPLVDETRVVDDLEAIRRAYRDFPKAFAGDLDSYLAEVDPDVEWVPIMAALEGRVYRGHEGVRRWLEDLRRDWEVFTPIAEEIRILGNDHYLVLGHWRARGRGSGIELDDQPAAWLMHRKDGRTDRLQTFTDRDEALKAAESLPSSQPA
jgi:ketosteroid isomerase-like protein